MPGSKEARHRNVAGQLISKIGLPQINGIVRRAIHPSSSSNSQVLATAALAR